MIMKNCDGTKNPVDEHENLEFYGYRSNIYKTVVIYFLYLLSFGLLRLLFHWLPTWRLYTTHSRSGLDTADKLLIIDYFQSLCKSYFVEEIKCVSSSEGNKLLIAYLEDGSIKRSEQFRMVWCKKRCYIWDEESSQFLKLSGLEKSQKCSDYYNFEGYSQDERNARLITYGKNDIDVPVHTILALFFLEVLTPFYFFQVFSLLVWFFDHYYYYTIAIIVMSVFGISTSIIQTRKNQASLKKTIHSFDMISVCKGNDEFEDIPSYDLVPGDIIEIPKGGCVMQCDAVLINGNCVVNESMLTGESVPVPKTPIPKTNLSYNIQEDSFHTLFCGTKIIQTRAPESQKVLAVVIRTGYLTSKGELVRSILYPTPSDFKFDQDSYKVIGILTIVALSGAVYTVVSKSTRSIEIGYIFLKALDLITIVIPPALPAAITVGKLYALHRLKKKNIFCINSKVINVSGTIDCMCFDKTGTLTEEGLDMWGVASVIDQKLKEPLKDVTSLPSNSQLLKGMATCHSLTVINDQLMGDPLDIKMFESTGWSLIEDITTHTTKVKHQHDDGLEILRTFPFSSNLQRMSVICKSKNTDHLEVYCKGSPEMISSLSVPFSVPIDLYQQLKLFTKNGYRVIAVGCKRIPVTDSEEIKKIERTFIESNLSFVGLIVLENRVKPATAGIIRTLKEANIKTVMITGDNIETAVSVAKECGMIECDKIVVVGVEDANTEKPYLSYSLDEPSKASPHNKKDVALQIDKADISYVMSGTTWELVQKHFPVYIDDFVQNGVVFARMSGLQKQELIQELKKQGYYTGMCGDGANDCGALKTSHVGISLSEEESSVASPFTSKENNISCVEKIIREGRGALATSMGIFKFMICYSITQFISAIVLYGIDDNLTSLQFLFVDIFIILNLTSTFGKTKAYKGPLDKNRPLDSLLSFTSVTSILLQLLFATIFQASAYHLIQTYSWFVPFQFDQNDPLALSGHQNYAVYLMSLFQYLIVIVAFSKGKPYRKPIYTNKIFTGDIILMTTICLYILFYPAEWVKNVLDLEVPPDYTFNFTLLGFVVINFMCSIISEDLFVEYFLTKKIYPIFHKLFKTKKYKQCVGRSTEEEKQINGFINHGYRSIDDIL